jgi:hypothetical protein
VFTMDIIRGLSIGAESASAVDDMSYSFCTTLLSNLILWSLSIPLCQNCTWVRADKVRKATQVCASLLVHLVDKALEQLSDRCLGSLPFLDEQEMIISMALLLLPPFSSYMA